MTLDSRGPACFSSKYCSDCTYIHTQQ